MIDKRNYEKFFTQKETASFMAEILNPSSTDTVLEPSAGNGSLCKAIKNKNSGCMVVAVELYSEFKEHLLQYADIVLIKDFLDFNPVQRFTSSISNPPFGNETNINLHFEKIRELVIKGGGIVSILPDDFNIIKNHKSYPLKNWATNKDGTITPIKIVHLLN